MLDDPIRALVFAATSRKAQQIQTLKERNCILSVVLLARAFHKQPSWKFKRSLLILSVVNFR